MAKPTKQQATVLHLYKTSLNLSYQLAALINDDDIKPHYEGLQNNFDKLSSLWADLDKPAMVYPNKDDFFDLEKNNN